MSMGSADESEIRGDVAPTGLPPVVRRTLERLAEVVCPPDLVELGLRDAVIEHAAASVASMPAYVRAGLLVGALTFEAGAMVWPRTAGRPFSILDATRAEAYFLAWAHGPVAPFRQLAKALKGFLCLGYYEQPEVRRRMGFAPEAWIAKVTRERIERHGEDIRRHEAAVGAPDVPLGRLRPRAPAGIEAPAKEVA